jgi:hypothetical protein
MRALFLLLALTVAGTLHASEADPVEARKGNCASSAPEEARVAETAGGATDTGTPPPPRGSTEAINDRSRMSPRWHSLLPGMYR